MKFISIRTYSIFILIFIFFTAPAILLAAGSEVGVVPLVPLPGLTDRSFNAETYLQTLYIIAIAAAGLLAVGKLMLAGFVYLTSEIITTKGNAKKDIQSALVGLLIVLSAVAVLRTINPKLANLAGIETIKVKVTEPYAVAVGSPIPGSSEVLKDGDVLYFMNKASKDACKEKYGTILPGSGNIADRCLIKLSDRQAALPKVASENCPAEKECRAELCDVKATGLFTTCEDQCKERNGIYYDKNLNGCVFLNKTSVTGNLNVNPDTTYHIVQNADEIAGGYPPKKITIKSTQSVDGLVDVELDDGTNTKISCASITPSVCTPITFDRTIMYTIDDPAIPEAGIEAHPHNGEKVTLVKQQQITSGMSAKFPDGSISGENPATITGYTIKFADGKEGYTDCASLKPIPPGC